MTTAKFSGGQSNPTFKVSAASGDYVLRRQPLGKLLKSAHAVDREAIVRVVYGRTAGWAGNDSHLVAADANFVAP